MGKVIQMDGWRSRKVRHRLLADREERAKIMATNPEYVEQTAIFTRIKDLLKKSIERNSDIYRLPTVQEREGAAVSSLGFYMEAINYAKEHGVTIRRRDIDAGEPYSYEVIGFGQILHVR